MSWPATVVVTVLACVLCIAVDHWVHEGLRGRGAPGSQGESPRIQRVEVRPQETRERDEDDESPPQAPHRSAA